jgi:hypothetical protein
VRQIVDGYDVFVVDFDTMPQLPITGIGEEKPYAAALDAAIRTGIITEPGKYGIHIPSNDEPMRYSIFIIKE